MPGMKLWQFFLPYPQEIVDHGLELTLGEYRLLGYLIRHQTRLGRVSIKLSQDEVLNGRKLPDGKRLDYGCRIKNSRDLIEARRRLIERGWIQYRESSEGFVYEIVIAEQPALSTRSTGQVQNVPADRNKLNPTSGTKCTQNQVQNEPGDKGSRRLVEGKKKEPSESSDSVAEDSLHGQIRKLWIQTQAKATGIRPELVMWDGREGVALARLLKAKSSLTLADATRCIKNYFASEINVSVRPAKVIPNLFDYWEDALDRFGKPKILSKAVGYDAGR